MNKFKILTGDALEQLRTIPDESVQCCVTSPPYWGLRDYGVNGQLGLERTPEEYVAKLVEIFREVRRVLRGDGTLWLNLGDTFARSDKKGGSGFGGKEQSYLGGNYRRARADVPADLKPKDLIGIPWRVAFALQADGWWLRSDIIWAKPNPMPEPVTDRPTKAHEYLFLMAKSARYFYDAEAIAEPYAEKSFTTLGAAHGGYGDGSGMVHAENWRRDVSERKLTGVGGDTHRNKRSVWTIATQPYPEAHFATFPPKLVEPCILAGCPVGGTVLDPFSGAGTTGLVALRLNRAFVGIELNPDYVEMATRRIEDDAPLFNRK